MSFLTNNLVATATSVQPDVVPTSAPPVVTGVKVIDTFSLASPTAEPSSNVSVASGASLMFSFEAAGYCTRDILEESLPKESAPATTIILTPGGPPPSRIPSSASSVLQLLAPHISAATCGQDSSHSCNVDVYGPVINNCSIVSISSHPNSLG